MADIVRASRLRGASRPDRRTVLSTAAIVAVAFVLDAAVVYRALATVLSASCGQDWAWLVSFGAAAVASVAATVAVFGLSWWVVRGVRPGALVRWRRVLLTATATACLVAAGATLWLPTGAC